MPIRSQRNLRAIVIAALVTVALAACASAGPPPDTIVRNRVDLARYMGRWHVIAHVPYQAERGHVAGSHDYRLQPNGDIALRYDYRTGFAQPQQSRAARVAVERGSGNRDWIVWWYRVLPGRYRILEVAPDYSWALVDHPGRDLAWVLAREPVIDEALYRDLLRRLRGYGVDTDKLWRVPQRPEQVGKLGFAQPEDP